MVCIQSHVNSGKLKSPSKNMLGSDMVSKNENRELRSFCLGGLYQATNVSVDPKIDSLTARISVVIEE